MPPDENNSPETQVTIVNNSEEIQNDTGGENSSNTSNEASEVSDEGISNATSSDDGTLTGTHAGESDAVAIAGIEAERDIAVASIAADVEQTRIERSADTLEEIIENKSEIELCHEEIARLTDRLALMETLLTPSAPQIQEAIAEEVAETIMEEAELETPSEENLTPPSIVIPTLKTQTEVSDENVEEKLEAEVTKARRRFIPI